MTIEDFPMVLRATGSRGNYARFNKCWRAGCATAISLNDELGLCDRHKEELQGW